MEIWIIAVIIAGGIIFLALLALMIYKCCCRRPNRKNDKRNGKEQNGHVWQVHDKDVELADEEPQGRLKEDGLCKDTEAGSTFPRRIKAEDQNPQPKRKDGLCEDTDKRFTYPRRGRPEIELLLPSDKNNLTAPVGGSVIKSSVGKDERRKSEVQVHRAEHGTSKKQVKEKDGSSDSSSDSDNNESHQNGAKHLITSSNKKGRKGPRARSFVERERSKSLHCSLDVPEYRKPMKRAVSNPSVVARERMLQKDTRFESLETWRSTISIPEPDYPNDISTARPNDDDDQDNAPPSYATSDSGVECLDALSGHDDESINHCDSVPESPGIPLQLKDETSFSSFKETSYTERTEIKYQESKHITHTDDYGINGFQGNAVVMTTKDHTALIDANVVKHSPSPFAANQQSVFFQSTPTDDKQRSTSSPYSDPKVALRNTTSPTANSVSNSRQSPVERIHTKEEQMDFRSVKLRPTSTNYEQNHAFTILGSNHGYKAVAPSSEKTEQPIFVEQQKTKNQDIALPSHSDKSVIINATDGPKAHYILGGSKKQANDAEKNATQFNIPEAEKRTDFHRVHLRQTPQSLKQHIGFREELEPRVLTETQARDDDSTTHNKENEKESETVIGVLDGIKRFQTQGAHVPKPAYGSHYISKKGPNQKPVSIVPQEPATNLRPVVEPEPSTTTTVKAHQNENAPIINKNEKIKPGSVNESVVSEDRRHIRYSTGNVNQNQVSLGFKDLSPKPITVIQGLDEEKKTNTTSNKQEPLEKPLAIVTPQSPKAKRESPEERAAFEEERKKNWKREQIEQKLTSAHLRSQTQNEQLMQASGLAYRQCMPELFSKIKQIGEERDETPVK